MKMVAVLPGVPLQNVGGPGMDSDMRLKRYQRKRLSLKSYKYFRGVYNNGLIFRSSYTDNNMSPLLEVWSKNGWRTYGYALARHAFIPITEKEAFIEIL